MIVVDDALLGGVLAGQPHESIASVPDRATTGMWYFRLCRAVFGGGGGHLSKTFSDIDVDARLELLTAHDGIDVIGLPTLAPQAGLLAHDERLALPLNALGAEAIAAAHRLGAELVLSTNNPALRAAAEHHEIAYRVASLR